MNNDKPSASPDEEDDDEQLELPLEEEVRELDFDRTQPRQWEETFERDFEEELENIEDLDTELEPLDDEDLTLLE